MSLPACEPPASSSSPPVTCRTEQLRAQPSYETACGTWPALRTGTIRLMPASPQEEDMQFRSRALILAPALMLAAACSNDRQQVAADTALKNDLTLAAQARPAGSLDSISAAERLNGGVASAAAK